ncbi:hypothetical protein TIFTF001_020989 [Ficus carica]|uniref:Uncharacterized protein n=1 Tax=Ficus carica TaxID=3494 RepID=A0AA88AH49_FICCA|nr:hypothetical protein TIFTF001_020989 [Ficus carica]
MLPRNSPHVEGHHQPHNCRHHRPEFLVGGHRRLATQKLVGYLAGTPGIRGNHYQRCGLHDLRRRSPDRLCFGVGGGQTHRPEADVGYPGLGHCDSSLGRRDFRPDGVGPPEVRPEGSTPPNRHAPGSVGHQSSLTDVIARVAILQPITYLTRKPLVSPMSHFNSQRSHHLREIAKCFFETIEPLFNSFEPPFVVGGSLSTRTVLSHQDLVKIQALIPILVQQNKCFKRNC